MKHGRRDANQAEIVAALEAAGASVLDLADMGRGCPDLLVGYAGHAWLMEVKTATGKLTPDEIAFARGWHGQVHVVHSAEEALAVIGFREWQP
jgi:hypothetical protein